MPERVPFNRPFIVGKELEYIADAVARGQLSGNGSYTHRCQDLLSSMSGGGRVFLTSSCTAALEMASLLCDVDPGAEVILPSFTFVTTATAFALRGAKLRFVDIRPDTLNLDEEQVEAAITPATRIICPVHYAGVGCEMDRLLEIANARGVRVIEDAAHGLTATYKNKPLGSFGSLGAFSFHETKNFVAGEGGALVVNDPALIARAEVMWEKGTNRSRFLRGEVAKYSWVDLGSSFYPSELVAAFLFAQLEEAEAISARRRARWRRYEEGLLDLQDAGHLRLPVVPAHCEHNAHLFYLLLESREVRDRLLAHLERLQINAVFHYVPLHSSPMGKQLGHDRQHLPVTDDISGRLLRLPLFFNLGEESQERVLNGVRSFFSAGLSHAPAPAPNAFEALEQRSRDYYRATLAEHGSEARGMDWKDAASQRLRFDVLARHMDWSSPRSVLDVGCGNGEFLAYCRERSLPLSSYRGLDVCPEMVEACCARFGDGVARQGTARALAAGEERWDYVIASGTFSVKQDATDQDWTAFVHESVRAMFSACRLGVVLNVMTSRVDWRYERLFYPTQEELAEFAFTLSPRFVIDHNYPLFEQTLAVYRPRAERGGSVA